MKDLKLIYPVFYCEPPPISFFMDGEKKTLGNYGVSNLKKSGENTNKLHFIHTETDKLI